MTVPALLPGPWTPDRALVGVFHLVFLAGALRRANGAPEPRPVDAWIPLLALPFLYWEIPFLNQGWSTGYHDPLVAGWEAALFGSPATELAGRLPYPLLSEALHLAYVAYYPIIVLPPAILFFQGRHRAFVRSVLALMASATACYVVFVYFPVQGPRYFGAPEGVPDGPVRRLTLAILEGGSSRGAAFPSSHMAITAAQAVATLVFLRPVGIVVALIGAGLGVGAVYGGFHYAVDMVVGLVGGVATATLALRLSRD